MKELLEKIQGLIEVYNNLPNIEQVALVSKEYIESTNIPILEEVIDVSGLKICVYNDDKVGIFQSICYSSPKTKSRYNNDIWDAGVIYLGYNSTYRAAKKTHVNAAFMSENCFLDEGDSITIDGKAYVVNCKIQEEISFDEMRLLMYKEGKIGSFKLGVSTNRELIDVLSFAHQYFGENAKNSTKIKRKNQI